MEENIKAIISRYTKIPVEQINSSTVIDRSAVAGSILLHRMYGSLANEGFVVENYFDINNYGILLQRLNGVEISKNTQVAEPEFIIAGLYTETGDPAFNGTGIDIENINALPQVNDFREDEFYKMNFTPAEIAYCILQPNALVSFAGLFAAKEAIVKANNAYKNRPFNTIFIDHSPTGQPVYKGFQLSIAHTTELAVAIATNIGTASPSSIQKIEADNPSKNKSSLALWFAFLAFILSIASIILFLARH